MPGNQSLSELILDIAESRREATDNEVQRIRKGVADAGFEPGAWTRAGARIAGLEWQGEIVQSGSRLDNQVVHYLRHAVAQSEWSTGTSLEEYLLDLRSTVEDPEGGILLTKRFGEWLLTFVAEMVDPENAIKEQWVAVGYGVNYGYWTTGYRPSLGLAHFMPVEIEGERWLRHPRGQRT